MQKQNKTMKKVSLMLLFSMLLCGAVVAQNKANMRFVKTTYDFGRIQEQIGEVSTIFEFTNTGKTPLIINRVQASCGCTTPSYSKEPVLPGKKGQITAKYSTTGRPGTFNKTISVYTNVPDTIYVLTIKGNVIPKK
jgi:hypothetical protein